MRGVIPDSLRARGREQLGGRGLPSEPLSAGGRAALSISPWVRSVGPQDHSIASTWELVSRSGQLSPGPTLNLLKQKLGGGAQQPVLTGPSGHARSKFKRHRTGGSGPNASSAPRRERPPGSGPGRFGEVDRGRLL